MAASTRRHEQPADRQPAAGIARPEARRIQALDRRGSRRVVLPRAPVRFVVRQIGADHDQSVGPAPQSVQHLRDLAGGRLADQEGHERKVAEHGLQERQLDLERVLLLVRGVRHARLRQVAESLDRRPIQRHVAKRRAKRIGARHGNAAERHEVRWTDHDRAPDGRDAVAERSECMPGHRPGVDVAGMRRDHRFGRGCGARPVCHGEIAVDRGAQAGRIIGIEAAGHRGRPYRAHRPLPRLRGFVLKAHLMWHAKRRD